MDFTILATAAVSRLVDIIKESKGGKKASEDLSSAIWDWIRPIFLKDETPINELSENPDNQDNFDEVKIKVKKHLENNPDSIELLKTILNQVQQSNTNTQNLHYGTGDIFSGGMKIIVNNDRNS